MEQWKDENYQYIEERFTTDDPDSRWPKIEAEILNHGYEVMKKDVEPSKNPSIGAYTIVVISRRSLNYNRDNSYDSGMRRGM